MCVEHLLLKGGKTRQKVRLDFRKHSLCSEWNISISIPIQRRICLFENLCGHGKELCVLIVLFFWRTLSCKVLSLKSPLPQRQGKWQQLQMRKMIVYFKDTYIPRAGLLPFIGQLNTGVNYSLGWPSLLIE